MNRRQQQDAEQPLRRQKVRDRATVLPLIGLALLVPPIAGIFEFDARIAGLPFTVVYLFGVWGALIVGAAVLARELRRELEAAGEPARDVDSASEDQPVR